MSVRAARIADWTGLAVVLYGTFAAALTAFVVYHRQSVVESPIDVNGFGLLSRNVALGHGFSLGYGPTIRRAPLYPLLGAALLKLFGHDAPGIPDAVAYRPILIAQCLIFGLTCLTAWAVARRLFGPHVALLAALLCPLLPQSLRYVGQTEVETLMGCFIVLLAYTGLKLHDRPSPLTGACFGLTAAAATLTKPVTLFFPCLFLLIAWQQWRATAGAAPARPLLTCTRLTASIAALLFLGLPLLPWTIRNLAVTDGQFVGISSNGPGESLRGYVSAQAKYALLRVDYSAWDPEANAAEERLLRQHGATFYRFNAPHEGTIRVTPPIPAGVSTATLEAQKDRIEGAEVASRLRRDPAGFLRKVAIQLATFWYLVEGRAKSALVGALALIVLALAALGVMRARRQGVTTWPIVAVVLYLNLVYAATLAMGRYAMPLYPTLLILSANGLAALVPRSVVRALPARFVAARSPAAPT